MMVLSGMSDMVQLEDNTSYIQNFRLLNKQEIKVVEDAVKTLHAAYANLIKTNGKASSCIGCKMCEKHCQQHIEISKWMKEAAQTFEA